ncbi:MAG: hypothetical protein ACMXX8_01845 [Candidatus Woesearchaeota archaeon]
MHDIKEFNNSVKYYMKQFKDIKKNIYIKLDIKNKNAFFSIAPLSKALHNLNLDLYVNSSEDDFETFKDIWKNKNKFYEFIKYIKNKKVKNFNKIFDEPLIIETKKDCFSFNDKEIKFKHKWVKKNNLKKLNETCTLIWNKVYNLKKKETVNVVFTLIPKKLDRPLNDLLDSYLIANAMYENCGERNKRISANSLRESVNEEAENVSELYATIIGCEFSKNINEEIFKIYNKATKDIKINFKTYDAVFGIFGKGVHGKHNFGEVIGYPTLNKKSRWNNPGAMFYKLPWHPQSKHEDRDPFSRIGFTDTLPVKLFIQTCLIDWDEMHRKNQKITNIMNKCDYVIVEGKKTKFKVDINKREAMNSDYDVRHKIDKNMEKKTGKRYGNMSNLPGGESFITPNYIEGIFYGDVVINVDASYTLNEKNPLVIKCSKKGYEIVKGPKKIINKIKEKKKDAWKKIISQEKNKSLPKEIIELKKNNFNSVGEFAINTNPKAELCDYLIVNEKIADMMHIAIGSGFDADKATDYHYDIVFNAKKQELDVYGISKGKKYDIMKKGKLVV